ncbi:rod shape-determining protein MreC [Polynucleobacter brandtiae]|uniref:Cell shape-determining protein MreC n=1 Tax=Polynucleobacter brandtiae TaxID=1938816 RepID=A0A2M8VQN8_9BURK|nr:rod shape-determining protein MreC [Polynucleobacter brandtiae]PJI79477.1 rod shape-determining protein MreC [Polynucleobacter brandtiae]
MRNNAPPLFRQGIPALVKLIVCLSVSAALMLIDFRFKALDPIRNNLNWLLRPLEYAMMMPRNAYEASSEYFTTRGTLDQENQAMRVRQAELSLLANQSEFLLVENQNLRQLMGLQKQVPFKTLPVEILFNPPNPISQRIVVNRGSGDGLKLGNPIANDEGILGQVVRLYENSAEVSLLEDRDFAVPVQIARNGLRAAVFGAGRGNPLELRYLPIASDLEVGDVLITSGIDGIYPPGFAVAVISRIERNADKNSANVFCIPAAPVNRYRQALALLYDPQWDAKASAASNNSGAVQTNAPGRRQTRARGMQ